MISVPLFLGAKALMAGLAGVGHRLEFVPSRFGCQARSESFNGHLSGHSGLSFRGHTRWPARLEIKPGRSHTTTAKLLVGFAAIAVGHRDWPGSHFKRVAVVAIALGLGYTIFSEWLNVFVRGTWSYSEWMPIMAFRGWEVGLSPLLQWSIVPTLCFVLTRHGARTVFRPR
jgi:hypothetical protein